MKVTHRDPGESFALPKVPLVLPNSEIQVGPKAAQRLKYDSRLTAHSGDPQFPLWILLHLRLLFCTAKFKTFRGEFSLTALI